jgi:TatD DNase family protein
MSFPVLVDTHCHFDFHEFDNDRLELLKQCQAVNIRAIVIPGVTQQSWQNLLQLCRSHENLYPALGLHPCFLAEQQRAALDSLAQLCVNENLVAIGEIGLDFYKRAGQQSKSESHDPTAVKIRQINFFTEQLQIAKQHQLPVLIHALKAHDEVIRQLKLIRPAGGIIHAFSGSYEQAVEYLKLGFKLGFGGAFTYPKATRLRALVGRLPLDAWVLETDAPDMTPIQHQGERNSPLNLIEIAQTFIALQPEPVDRDTIVQQLITNTLSVFPGIKC